MKEEKELVFLSACPDDLHFKWQVEVQLHNFKRVGILDKYKYIILVWINDQRKGLGIKNNPQWTKEWKTLADLYKNDNVEIHFYLDYSGLLVQNIVRYSYASLVRPWILKNHFEKYPDLKNKALFYLDADVLFTRFPDFIDKYKDDNISYMSDTRGYIAASYFDSKINDVLPDKLETYKKIDVLNETMQELGLTRKVAEENEYNSGGAQYILKNIDAEFWKEAFKACIDIKMILRSFNRRFFENENKGFQSWCADMWAVLWLVWKRGGTTACPPEMDFCWATDMIEKIRPEKGDGLYIFHNAGVTPDSIKHKDKFHQLFYKSEQKYVNNDNTPFYQDFDYVSKDFASIFYVDEIKMVSKKYHSTEKLLIDALSL